MSVRRRPAGKVRDELYRREQEVGGRRPKARGLIFVDGSLVVPLHSSRAQNAAVAWTARPLPENLNLTRLAGDIPGPRGHLSRPLRQHLDGEA